jgi:glycosyltransferase involved in cell wall biosynthesis
MATQDAGRLDIAQVGYRDAGEVPAQLARALAARGHAVRALCPVGELEPRDPRTGARRLSGGVLVHLAASALRFGRDAVAHRWNTAFAFDVHSARAGRLLRALDPAPDVVLQHGALFAPGAPPPYPYVLYCDDTRALAAARGAAGDYGPAWRARESAVYAGARAICTTSERVSRSVVRDCAAPADRVHVAGVGAGLCPERPARVDDGRTILFHCDDFEARGGPLLVEAFGAVRRRHPKARLLVTGPRSRHALPAGAVHLGPVPAPELADVLAIATVFALPGPREPSGVAFLDAMACAVPCVGPRAGAIPEVVDDGETGRLVPPGDAAALAAALEALLGDGPRRRGMGEAGRRAVLARFRWAHVARRVEAVLGAASEGPVRDFAA